MISRDTVKHVAELASLSLHDEEIDSLTRELESIVSYVEQLSAISTEGVPPFSHAPVHASLRADVPAPCLSREEVLSQAPNANEDGFVVPKFVGGA